MSVLHVEYNKVNPDIFVVEDRMRRTFAWRRNEILQGMTVDAILSKYPFLRSAQGLCNEVDRMHPADVNSLQRWRENLTKIVPKVISLVQGKCSLAKAHNTARAETVAEDLPAVDFRAALVMLPHLFKEKTDRLIRVDKTGAFCPSPYPTVQLVDVDWRTALTTKIPFTVTVDGTHLCQGTGVEEGIVAAFSAYYVFNLAYPPFLKNTLTFLQRIVLNISEVGDKPPPITVTRIINLLY